MMRRRAFLTALLGISASWPARALSQQAGRVYRIGVLSTSQRTSDINAGFIDELARLGFVEDKNLVILEQGFGKGREQFAAMAKEFVEAKVDAIVASSGALAIRAAQGATTSIPIVGIADDMVLGRPCQIDRQSRRQHHGPQLARSPARRQASGNPDGAVAERAPHGGHL
jgi:ABC-type uncharacterized transport system substrate-binding protein